MGTLTPRRGSLLALWLLLFWIPALCCAAVTGRVSWVYDGDTLEVSGVGKVRLLGIDTPESKESPRDHFYWEEYRIPAGRLRQIAADALARNIQRVKGERVRLEFDRQKQDRFGRTLAYLYLPDGSLLNRQLIQEGLASTYRRYDFRLKQEFLDIEQQAREAAIGLWAQ
jgi:micrococcal nuclease